MSITTHVATVDRRAVFIKRASSSASAARLAREAEMLARVAGPGVVELVEFREEGPAAVLVTCFVGGGTIAEPTCRSPVAPEAVAALAASVCETLAAAHDRGVVHGRLRAEHVLVPTSREPVLCGWGEATMIAEPTSDRPTGAPTPADDVAGAASVVIEMLGDASGPLARKLHAVAQRALAGSASAGGRGVSLSMATMAMACRALAPGAPSSPTPGAMPVGVLLGRPIHARHEARDARGRRRRAVLRRGGRERTGDRPGERLVRLRAFNGAPVRLAGVGVLAIAIVVGAFHVSRTSDASAAASSEAPATPEACGADRGSTPAVFDVDGDGCVEPIRLSANIASAGDVSWRVGDEGDLVVLGDWDGDGTDTPGVVRSTTGEVWIYQGWARTGEELLATPVETTVGERRIGAVRSARVLDAGPGGHDAIEVTDAEGVTHTIVP